MSDCSASETELAELGAESLASDLDVAGDGRLVSMVHKEIRPLRTCIADTGRTVSSIAETLYQIQDGINNLCCNVMQMKSRVLSTSLADAPSVFEEGGQAGGGGEEEALELVKDGEPVGEPEQLVHRVLHKLDSALRRRDENLKQAMVSLEEDNEHLRREVEIYRARETSGGQRTNELEAKIQEVLDNMERLRQRTPPGSALRPIIASTPREGEKELPPIDGKTVTRHKRRSKSRAKSKSRAQGSAKSSSSGTPKEGAIRSKVPCGDAAYQADSSTSSDSDVVARGGKLPSGGMQMDVLNTMVQTAQNDNQLLRQDLLVQKERESQLVKRNMELEAKLIRALTPRGVNSPKGERESPVGGPLPSEAVVPPIMRKGSASPRQDLQASLPPHTEDKACMTDLPPPLTFESPTSSSPSKSESPLKEGSNKGVSKVRKSRSKVKRGNTMQEVTEVIEVFGRGSGVDGGTPSPSPSRGEHAEEEDTKLSEEETKKAFIEASKATEKPAEEVPTEHKVELSQNPKTNKKDSEEAPKAAKAKTKAASVTRQQPIKVVKEEVSSKKGGQKESEKSTVEVSKSKTVGEKKESKSVKIDESLKKMPTQKDELKKSNITSKAKEKPIKSTTKGSSVTSVGDNKLIVNVSDTRSKVIEGDDFRVTITSNQDMLSCELSDREEEPGSPRKKIIITPKTPDKKTAGEKRKNEEKKTEEVVVAKKAGKIPIRQQYIKQVSFLCCKTNFLLIIFAIK